MLSLRIYLKKTEAIQAITLISSGFGGAGGIGLPFIATGVANLTNRLP